MVQGRGSFISCLPWWFFLGSLVRQLSHCGPEMLSHLLDLYVSCSWEAGDSKLCFLIAQSKVLEFSFLVTKDSCSPLNCGQRYGLYWLALPVAGSRLPPTQVASWLCKSMEYTRCSTTKVVGLSNLQHGMTCLKVADPPQFQPLDFCGEIIPFFKEVRKPDY